MASKLSDKDEVALLMQQQGLSRVQATKLIYEMAKQKKKEEANASAGSKGPSSAQPTVPDASIVKKNVERFSSLKDMTPYIPSMIHDDVDLTSERPTLKLGAGASFRYTTDGVSSVNIMAASLDSRSSKIKPASDQKNDPDDQDDDETEVVTPFDEDKFSESLQSLEVPLDDSELSPTAIAGGSLVTPPARRRSSNSALNLRPLARLHPGKFQKDGQALSGGGGDDEDDDTPPPEIEYQSGNSSDAKEWEEPTPKPAPPQFKPPTLAAPVKAMEPAAVPAPAPAVVAAAKPSLASKLLQPVAPKPAEAALVAPSVTAAPAAPKVGLAPPAPPVLSNPQVAPGVSSASSTVTSSESKSFTSNTTTSTAKTVSSMAVPIPAPVSTPVPAAPLALEEKVALLNSGKYSGAEGSGPVAMIPVAASADVPKSPTPLSTARANEVLNVKVGNKKLTVRASFTAGSAGGSIAAAAAAAAAAAELPPPPPYVPSAAPPPAYDAPPPEYSSPPPSASAASAVAPPALSERVLPPAPVHESPVSVLKRPSLPPVVPSTKENTSSANLTSEVSKKSEVTQHASSSMSIRTDAAYLAPTPLSDVEEEDEGEEEETGTAEERIAKMMAKYRRKSYMKKESPVGAFKDLTPIDDADIGKLMYQEQKEREAAAVRGQRTQQANGTSSSATTASAASTIIETEILAAPAPQMVAAVMNKDSTDLVEELISQGYSRENAITLAKEIELDRRGERFHTRHAAPPPFPDTPNGYRNGGGPPRSGASVTSHTSSINHNNFRERSSFDRSFNDDDGGSVVSNISGVSRASSYCESDKLLMNLLLSQQKGKYGVNMYESLTNHDEVAIEKYMAKGCTLDQAVLKVFEKKYGSVDNQVLPKSVYGTTNGMSGAGKAALNGEEALEIVDTMHAEIELLMLSGGYSRDVAVKMLLSKVAKEKALQAQSQQQSVGGLMAGEHEHHLHKAASMTNMMPVHHYHEPEPLKQYGNSNSSSHTQQTHTLHASRSMYTMPTSGGSVASAGSGRGRPDVPPLTGFSNQHAPPIPSPRTQEAMYSHGNFAAPMPSPRTQDPAFPTQYPPTHGNGHSSHSRHHGSSFDAGSQARRRPSGSNMSVASGIASVNSASGRVSHISGTSAGSRTQDDRDYIPALLREQEAAFGVNMYEYLAPDDPEVARLMSQFNFTKIDAMIAVFQQFPPQVGAGPRRPEQHDASRSHRPAPAPRPGPPAPPGPSNGRPAPKPAAAAAAYNEEEELQRVMRLSMMEHENVPGAVVMPGLGASNQRPAWGAQSSGPPPNHGGAGHRQASNMDIMSLVQMGFTAAQAQDALARHNFDVHQAANYLLGGL